jgi:hypothetical protein
MKPSFLGENLFAQILCLPVSLQDKGECIRIFQSEAIHDLTLQRDGFQNNKNIFLHSRGHQQNNGTESLMVRPFES